MRNYFLALICLISILSSCKSPKPLQYLGNGQKGDVLGITIYSDNPEATAIYNQPNTAVSSAGAAASAGGGLPTTPGYQVDYSGNIQMQGAGNIMVEGLTRVQLADLLKSKYSNVLQNPYAIVKFLNYKVTVMGEVARPGVVAFQGDHLTVLQALGLAGDISIYGLKDSILLIREYNGKREIANINATSPDLMLTPYYYMQQNDMLIVRANPKKPTVDVEVNTRRLGIVTAIMAIVTSAAVLVTLFR